MTAVVSVPWPLAGVVGWQLGHGRSIPTKEAPEVGRVYMLVPVDEQFARCSFRGLVDVDITYFETERGAMAWGERDVERRLEVEE